MQSSPTNDSRSLALGCSALARAGQILSTANAPAQARAALRQVADQLASDRNLSALIATDDIAKKCREAADGEDAAATITACRQVATQLARRASSLAAEIQQKPAGATAARPAPAPMPVSTVSSPPPPPAAATVLPAPPQPIPTPAPAPAAAPEIVPPTERTPAPRPTPKPAPQQPAATPIQRVDPALVQRVTIARSTLERQAVAAALEAGRRFAVVSNGTLIDIRTNRMWTAHLSQGVTHPEALRLAASCDTGGNSGWRLPQADELRELLSENGLQALRAVGSLPAAGAALLWSGEVRSRFFGFLKDALAAQSGTGDLTRQSLKNNAVQALFVRD